MAGWLARYFVRGSSGRGSRVWLGGSRPDASLRKPADPNGCTARFDQKSVDGALRMMVLFDVLSDEERKRIRDAMPGPAGIRLTGPRLIIPLALFQNLARERPL